MKDITYTVENGDLAAHAAKQKELHKKLLAENPNKSFAIRWSKPTPKGQVIGTVFEATQVNNG